MIHSIFYSWQSDLPVSENKSYISSCLSKAVQKLKTEKKFSLEYVIDRATNNRIGTIDIADSIFKKINIAKLFVADISIINSKNRKYRKTPNPNVLLELGYAVRTIGWENVVCVYNTKYGKPEDLPFDLRNRRLVLYNSDNDKSHLTNDLLQIITASNNFQVPSDIIRDFYTANIYTLLFRLISDITKALLGYENRITLANIQYVLNLNNKDISEIASIQKLIGFQLFKSYPSVVDELKTQLEKILTIRQYNDAYYVPLVRLIELLKMHDKALNRWFKIKMLNPTELRGHSMFSTIKNSNTIDLPFRYVLVRKLQDLDNAGMVIDFGDFMNKDYQDNLLQEYMLSGQSLNFFTHFYSEAIAITNEWIDYNGGEFILDETVFEFGHAYSKNSMNEKRD